MTLVAVRIDIAAIWSFNFCFVGTNLPCRNEDFFNGIILVPAWYYTLVKEDDFAYLISSMHNITLIHRFVELCAWRMRKYNTTKG